MKFLLIVITLGASLGTAEGRENNIFRIGNGSQINSLPHPGDDCEEEFQAYLSAIDHVEDCIDEENFACDTTFWVDITFCFYKQSQTYAAEIALDQALQDYILCSLENF